MLINGTIETTGQHYFQSTEEYIAWLRNTPEVAGACAESRVSHKAGPWSGATLSEAWHRAEHGDASQASKIKPADAVLEQTGALNAPVYDYTGDNVDVGLFCTGEPECMVTLKKRGKPIIKLIVNGSASCDVNADTILARGKAILEIMSGLESNGYGTEIVWVNTVTQGIRLAIKLKDAKEYFDLHKMAYWLVCPSVLRRFYFMYAERLPEGLQKKISYGYGTPTDATAVELAEESDHVYFPKIESSDTKQFEKQIKAVLERYAA